MPRAGWEFGSQRCYAHAPEAIPLLKTRRHLIVHLLSLALLIAQLGMSAHAYSHLKADTDGLPSQVQSCGHCLSFTPLLGMVDGSPHVWTVGHVDSDLVVADDASAIVVAPVWPSFRSRAPPIFL
jgi:hypothetical protein